MSYNESDLGRDFIPGISNEYDNADVPNKYPTKTKFFDLMDIPEEARSKDFTIIDQKGMIMIKFGEAFYNYINLPDQVGFTDFNYLNDMVHSVHSPNNEA